MANNAGHGSNSRSHSLSGCYLLIVVGEPTNSDQRDAMLQKINKGFQSWDLEGTGCCISAELQYLVDQDPQPEEAKNGEKLIQFVSENLVTEVLINPQLNTLQQCMKNLMNSYTKHKHIIHAGYSFIGSGSWILQDSTYSFSDFLDAFNDAEVQRLFKTYENCVSVHLHCASEGDWTTTRLNQEPSAKLVKLAINPNDKCSNLNGIANFVNYIGNYIVIQPLEKILEPSDVVGNIRFSRPTLYVFPGGQGDSALFGVNGFNMLIDGGFNRKACFWDFARHLDRVDAVLVTRLNNSNLNGVSSFFKRKAMGEVYPKIGHVFCNIMDRKHSPDGDKDAGSLLISLAEEGHSMMDNLRHLGLKPQNCFRYPTIEAINLYHKVGHGNLDMYVLNPAKDSKEVKEFLQQWHSQPSAFASSRLGVKVGNKELLFPLPNLMAICAILVWQPADTSDNITRILFPGSSPQTKIFEGLEKLQHLSIFKAPVCSENSLKVVSTKHKIKSFDMKTSHVSSKPKKIIATIKEVSTKESSKPVTPSEPVPIKKNYSTLISSSNKEKLVGESHQGISEGSKIDKPEKPPSLKDDTKQTISAYPKIENKKQEPKKLSNPIDKSFEKASEKKKVQVTTSKLAESQNIKSQSNVSKTISRPSTIISGSEKQTQKIISKPKGQKEATNKKAAEEKNKATVAAAKTSAPITKKISSESVSKPIKKSQQKIESPPTCVMPTVEIKNNFSTSRDLDNQQVFDNGEEEKVSIDEKQSLDEVKSEKDKKDDEMKEMIESSHTATTDEDVTVTSSVIGNQLYDSLEQHAPESKMSADTLDNKKHIENVPEVTEVVSSQKVDDNYEDHYDDRLHKLETILKQYKDISSSISRLPDFNNKNDHDDEDTKPIEEDKDVKESVDAENGSTDIQKIIDEKLSVIDDVLKISPTSELNASKDSNVVGIQEMMESEETQSTHKTDSQDLKNSKPEIDATSSTRDLGKFEKQNIENFGITDTSNNETNTLTQCESTEQHSKDAFMIDVNKELVKSDTDNVERLLDSSLTKPPVKEINDKHQFSEFNVVPEKLPLSKTETYTEDQVVDVDKKVKEITDKHSETIKNENQTVESSVMFQDKIDVHDELKEDKVSSLQTTVSPKVTPPLSPLPVANEQTFTSTSLEITNLTSEKDIKPISPAGAILSPIPENAPKVLKMMGETTIQGIKEEKAPQNIAEFQPTFFSQKPAPVEFLRTPDEVADLPIHEEVPTEYDGYYHFNRKSFEHSDTNNESVKRTQPIQNELLESNIASIKTEKQDFKDDDEEEEEPIIMGRLNADHAEVVHISNETSPSTTPHSPHSPKDKDAKEEHNGFVKASIITQKKDSEVKVEVPKTDLSNKDEPKGFYEPVYQDILNVSNDVLSSDQIEEPVTKSNEAKDITCSRPDEKFMLETIPGLTKLSIQSEEELNIPFQMDQSKHEYELDRSIELPRNEKERLDLKVETTSILEKPNEQENEKQIDKQYDKKISNEQQLDKLDIDLVQKIEVKETLFTDDEIDNKNEPSTQSKNFNEFSEGHLSKEKAGNVEKTSENENNKSLNKQEIDDITAECKEYEVENESIKQLKESFAEKHKDEIHGIESNTSKGPSSESDFKTDEKVLSSVTIDDKKADNISTVKEHISLVSDTTNTQNKNKQDDEEYTIENPDALQLSTKMFLDDKSTFMADNQLKEKLYEDKFISSYDSGDKYSDTTLHFPKEPCFGNRPSASPELIVTYDSGNEDYAKPFIKSDYEAEMTLEPTSDEKKGNEVSKTFGKEFQETAHDKDEAYMKLEETPTVEHYDLDVDIDKSTFQTIHKGEHKESLKNEYQEVQVPNVSETEFKQSIQPTDDSLTKTLFHEGIIEQELEIKPLAQKMTEETNLKENMSETRKFETLDTISKFGELKSTENNKNNTKQDLSMDIKPIPVNVNTSIEDSSLSLQYVPPAKIEEKISSPPKPHYEEPWSSLHSQMMANTEEILQQTESSNKWQDGSQAITYINEKESEKMNLINPFNTDPMTQSFYDFTTSASSMMDENDQILHDEKAIDDFASTHTQSDLKFNDDKQPDVIDAHSNVEAKAILSSLSKSPDVFSHKGEHGDKEYEGYYEVYHSQEESFPIISPQPGYGCEIKSKQDLDILSHVHQSPQQFKNEDKMHVSILTQKEAQSYDEKEHEETTAPLTDLPYKKPTLPMYTKTYLAEDEDDHLQIAIGRERSESFIGDPLSQVKSTVSPMEQSFHSDYGQPSIFAYEDVQEPQAFKQLSKVHLDEHYIAKDEETIHRTIPDVAHSPMYISADDDTEEEYKGQAMPQFVKSYPRPDNVPSDESDIELSHHGHDLTTGVHHLHRVLSGGRGAQSEAFDLYDKEANNLTQQDIVDNENYLTKESFEEGESRDIQSEERYSPICTPEYGGSPSYTRERSTSTETDVEEEEEDDEENQLRHQLHFSQRDTADSDKESPEMLRKPVHFVKEVHHRDVEGADSPYPTSTGSGAVSLSSPGDELSSSISTQDDKKISGKPMRNPFDEWGEPMGLPSPPPPPFSTDQQKSKTDGKSVMQNPIKKQQMSKTSETISDNKDKEELRKNGSSDNGVKSEKTWIKSHVTASPKRSPMSSSAPKGSPIKTKRPESPLLTSDKKSTKISPIYVDLTYIPHHGNPFYTDVEFFRTVRARYYVFSGTNPSKEVFNALLEAKQSWENPDLEVTIIPTYDTDTLGYWFAMNEELLSKNKIDLAPSASRCTINLQDHETSCSAYRLEF